MPTWKGMFKVRGKDGEPNKVMISDGDYTEDVYINEADYRAMNCNPPFDELEWSDQSES